MSSPFWACPCAPLPSFYFTAPWLLLSMPFCMGCQEHKREWETGIVTFRESLSVSSEQNSPFSVAFWLQFFSANLQCTVSNQTPFSTLQNFQPSGKHICRKLVLHTGRKNPSNFYKKRNKNTCFTAARLKIHIYSFFIFMLEIFLIFYLFISF